MTFSAVTEMPRRSVDATAPQRQHRPLSALDPRQPAEARSAGRVLDVPGRRKNPVTFDSAL
jgi:hypothetical protein